MTPLEIVRSAIARETGLDASLLVRSGLSEGEIAAFEARLPCPIPHDIRDLLAFRTGFYAGPDEIVDFTGRGFAFEFEKAFPHGLPIASDGWGNFWVVDLMPDSKAWSPIYFACHDPPVILLYSTSFDRFLVEFLKRSTPGLNTVIDSTGRDRVHYIWRKNPGVITYDQCLQSPDDELAAFARQLGPTFVFIDLRNAEIGSGFSWGRFGAATVVRRNGTLPIFAYETKPNALRRLFRLL